MPESGKETLTLAHSLGGTTIKINLYFQNIFSEESYISLEHWKALSKELPHFELNHKALLKLLRIWRRKQGLSTVAVEVLDYAAKQLYAPGKSLEENLRGVWTELSCVESAKKVFKAEEKEAGVYFFRKLSGEAMKKLTAAANRASLCDLHAEIDHLF
eukprot:TRINITY_DN11142_c0_g1_i1.p3 TRINITY_DN11142_c0_g1~~TRINITY_DN11142_c0_g1_i1.p3  ORF type:complete len:158 (-),score=55.28 TRINITY_DN11142_c0_g1_i1:130-603(-)